METDFPDTITEAIGDLQARFEHEIEQAYSRGYAAALAAHQASFNEALDKTVSASTAVFMPGRAVVSVWDRGTFFRADHETRPDYPTMLRIEANRALTEAEVADLWHLVAYNYASTVRGDGTSKPERDSTHSFVVDFDTTSSQRSDPMAALGDFEVNLDAWLTSGSPIRKTDRAGTGTAGTRAVEGLGDPNLRLSVYYDRVSQAPVSSAVA